VFTPNPNGGEETRVAKEQATTFEHDLTALVDAFRADNPATFYTLLVNSAVLPTVTQVENLWSRVDDEGDLQSIVYLHFLKGWQKIRTLALAGQGAVAGYLVEVIRNAIRDELRKRDRRKKLERSLVSGYEDRGNEAEAVADHGGSPLELAIAHETQASLLAASTDADLPKFGAVYKLKMLMRCAPDEFDDYALTPDEATWTPADTDYPHPRPAARPAAWLMRLRRWDPAGHRFKPTSRKIVRMLGMVRKNAPEQTLKDKSNTFDVWFRRAKLKLGLKPTQTR
jgi:hypothetical protein